MAMIRRIFSYMHRYRGYALAGVVCVTAESVFELLVPLLMADLVDVGVANGDVRYIYSRGALMVASAVLAFLLGAAGVVILVCLGKSHV